MKSIYELDMNVIMMVLGIIFACNGYTMALIVLSVCLIFTTIFFTNISMHQLIKTIKIAMVYTIGVVVLTMMVVPSIALGLTMALVCNCFCYFAWWHVALKRRKLMHRLFQISTVMIMVMIIFEIAALVLPVQGMLAYSPLVPPWLIRLTMMILVIWMVAPLPVTVLIHKHQRILLKQDRLVQRMLER